VWRGQRISAVNGLRAGRLCILGSISGTWKVSFPSPKILGLLWGPFSLLLIGIWGLSPWVNCPNCIANHLPVWVKDEWSYTPLSMYNFLTYTHTFTVNFYHTSTPYYLGCTLILDHMSEWTFTCMPSKWTFLMNFVYFFLCVVHFPQTLPENNFNFDWYNVFVPNFLNCNNTIIKKTATCVKCFYGALYQPFRFLSYTWNFTFISKHRD
jgi:hypothetical protein